MSFESHNANDNMAIVGYIQEYFLIAKSNCKGYFVKSSTAVDDLSKYTLYLSCDEIDPALQSVREYSRFFIGQFYFVYLFFVNYHLDIL